MYGMDLGLGTMFPRRHFNGGQTPKRIPFSIVFLLCCVYLSAWIIYSYLLLFLFLRVLPPGEEMLSTLYYLRK